MFTVVLGFLILFPPCLYLLVAVKSRNTFYKPYPTPPQLHAPNKGEVTYTTAKWLLDKGLDDKLKKSNLWRIHGRYYDLSAFVSIHPGGVDWLLYTKGSDCTEAFEVHHLNKEKVDAILRKYLVEDLVDEDIEARFTFQENGFYSILRRKIFQKLRNNYGPTPKMMYLTCFYLLLWATSFGITCLTGSVWAAVISGCLLLPIWGIGHNFFHQKDSPLRFLFNLTVCAVHEWRVSHALSHHQFANSQLDLEVKVLEPFYIFFFSSKDRPLLYRTLVLFYCQFIMCITLPVVFLKNLLFTLFRIQEFRLEYYIPLTELFFLIISGNSFLESIFLFFVMHSMMSFLLVGGSWPVHHHDGAWHDGDSFDERHRDYGKYIMDTTRDHSLVENLYFNFGFFAGLNDHRLHHLFPTIDHSRFEEIRPEFIETCKEFGLDWKPDTFCELYFGVLRRLVQKGTIVSEKKA